MRDSGIQLAAMLGLAVACVGCGDDTGDGARVADVAAPASAAPATVIDARADPLAEPARREVGVTVADVAGNPIEGAQVRVFVEDELGSWPFRPPRADQRDPIETALTDADGSVRVQVVCAAAVTIAVAAPGRVGDARDVSTEESSVTFRLEPGHVLEGAVTDGEGAPIVGAHVRIGTNFDRFSGMEPMVETDENGWYRFDCAPAGVVSVNAAPAGVASTRVTSVLVPSVSRFDVGIDLHGPICGVVRSLDTGEPVEGATVVASLGGWHSESVSATATTDADGRYEIPSWPNDGVDRVSPRKGGWYRRLGPDGAETTGLAFPLEGPLEVDLWMSPGARVEGVARGPEGAVADASVSLFEQGTESWWSTTTDGDGRYAFDGVARGDYVVLFEHPRLLAPPWPEDSHAIVEPGGELPWNGVRVEEATTLTVDLEFQRGRIVTGVLTDAGGAPRANARISGTGGKRATTGADGRFELSGFPEDGAISLSAGDGRNGYTIPDGAPPEELRDVALRWSPDAHASRVVEVRARLLDANEDPIAGGRIAAFPHGALSPLAAVTFASGWGSPATSGVAVTTVEGPGETIGVLATAPGCAPVSMDVACPEDGETRVVVTVDLRREAVLRGVVLAGDGRPLQGVRVALEKEEAFAGIACRMGQDLGPTILATTDAEGAFALGGLPAGPYRALLSASGFVDGDQPVTLRCGETTTFRRRLQQPRTIAGRVVGADGAPVTGADVRVWRNWNSEPEDADEGRGGWAETDETGTFRVTGLGGGVFDVTASPPGGDHGAVQTTLESVDPDVGPVELKLDPYRTVVGMVTDATGGPVEDARVRVAILDDDPYDVDVTASRLGRFEVAVPEGMSVRISASAPRLAGRTRVVAAGETDGSLVLDGGLAIVGVLRDEDGDPLEGESVVARRTDSTAGDVESPSALTNAEGRFRIVGLEPGVYELNSRELDRVSEDSLFEPRVASAGALDLELVRLRPVDLTFVAMDERGQPIARQWIVVQCANVRCVIESDDDGRVTSPRHRPGSEWRVSLYRPDAGESAGEWVVAGADEESVVLVDLGRLSGRVVDGRGTPIAGLELQVQAVHGSDDREFRTCTDGEGRFSVSGLTEDRYAVRGRFGDKWVAAPRAYPLQADLTIVLSPDDDADNDER